MLEPLLNRYGLKLVLAAGVFVVATWVIAHQMAEPGSTVSVGWGLVEYTKINEKENSHELVASTKSNNKSSVNSQLELTVSSENSVTSDSIKTSKISDVVERKTELKVLVFDGTQATHDEMLVKLRESSGLRALRHLESGSRIKNVGNQTYFFTLTAWLGMASDYMPLNDFKAHLEKTYKYNFELHKDNDSNLFLVGFMTQSDAQRLASSNEEELKRLLISPNYIDGFSSLVKLPVDYVSKFENRDIATVQDTEVAVLQFDYKK
ncbi:TPA: hypothetical protein I7774_21295 [Vibrio vulnificus]|nr:hypothetical protein [Vibrio vulnificus]